MLPLLNERREHLTPKFGTTTKRPTNNNGEVWGKQQQQQQQLVHRHQSRNFFNENDHYCDPYHILHIRRDATKYEMKRSYQQLALLYHPALTTTKMMQHKSTCSQEQHKQERSFLFTLIAASYETLSVKETRQRMDMILLQLQQQKNKKYQIQQRTTTMTSIKSEKHKITSPKINGNKDDTKSSSNNNIIISKAEYKIRKKLREERIQQQQQRRRDDSNKKKQSNTNSKTKEPQQMSRLKQNTVLPEIALSPSSSTTTSSYNYHHHHRRRRHATTTTTQHPPSMNYDSAQDTDDSKNNTHMKKYAISTTKARKVRQSQDNIDIPQKQKLRKHQKRGYHWAYVSSSCVCPNDDTADNDIQVFDRIPFDEPFDRIDDYDCQGRSNTTPLPAVTVVHQRSNDNSINNNSNVQPPSLVGSSDSEVNDDDNDSDYLLSLQNIAKDFYSLHQPTSTTISTNATERWFGGPLKLMYRARKFQPFTDPLVLFERTFRSGLLEQEQQQRTLTTNCNNDDDINNSIHKVVCLQPQSAIVSPSTLATFSSNCNVVPISAADDTIETLSDGTIITRTHRTIPITTTNTEKQQEETIYKTVTRTITRCPPPDPSCHNNNNNNSHHRRMTVSVTSDVVVRVEQKSLLSSSTSFNNKNHCVDCIGWMTCQSSENYYCNNSTTMSNEDHNGHFSFVSMFQSWLPSC